MSGSDQFRGSAQFVVISLEAHVLMCYMPASVTHPVPTPFRSDHWKVLCFLMQTTLYSLVSGKVMVHMIQFKVVA